MASFKNSEKLPQASATLKMIVDRKGARTRRAAITLLVVVAATLLFSVPWFAGWRLLHIALWLVVFLVILVVTFVWLYRLVITKNERRHFVPAIGLNCLSLLTLYFVMFGTAGIFVRFAIAYPARAAIVNQVTTGTIKPERDTGYGPEATLRAWYWPLASALNKVNIEQDEGRLAINFADVLGVTDNYSAFVYISDDSPPRDKDFGGDVIGYARVVPHWYYVTFT